MRITDFELQTASGQLWIDIQERLAAKDEEIAQMTAARDATRAAFEEKSAYQTAMEQRVSAVIQSGDPAQYEALARDFLTPAQEKERAEKLALLESLKAELGIE